jgi:FixJ family two-component response regulator
MKEETPMVFVVDDDLRVQKALSNLLSSAGYRIATFGSTSAFLDWERPDCPACLVLDVNLPRISGLELQEQLAGQELQIIFITGFGDVPSSVRAMKAGALDFLQKPVNADVLLQAIQAAIESDRVARNKRSELSELRKRYELLTPREREVLPFVTAGLLNKQTAAELGTAEITIRIHRGQIMRKMGARSLAELVRMVDKLRIA